MHRLTPVNHRTVSGVTINKSRPNPTQPDPLHSALLQSMQPRVPPNVANADGSATAAITAGDERARSIFVAHNLCKIYRMGDVEVHALRDVELTIYRSEFVVLLGPSGSGKSTLLNILGGLDVPTSGEALFAEHPLWCKRSRAPCAARDANERGVGAPRSCVA